MTKINKYIAIALIAASGFSAACNKFLDDPRPLTLIETDKALATTDGLEAALLGTYDGMQSFFLHAAMFKIAGDMIGGNITRTGKSALTFEETQMLTRSLSNVNNITTVMWGDAYMTINRANKVLGALPNVNDAKIAANKDRIRGEALFIRATTHFELVRYYGHPTTGLGVPLVLESAATMDVKPERATITQVYEQVVKDLREAITLLPATNADFGRATSWAAKAYLARVSLYQGNFQEALTQSNDVIQNGPFQLNAGVSDAFSPNTDKETIFKLLSTQADNSNGGLGGSFNSALSPKFGPSDAFMAFAQADPSDKRGTEWYEKVDGVNYIKKYNQDGNTPFKHVPVIRLAEMYLTRAEARLNLGIAADIVRQDYNRTRLRAGLAADNAATSKDALLNAIFVERSKELAFEGDEFHNRKRLKRDIAGLPYNSDKLVFPISQRELQVNPNLVQNPGY